MVKLTPCDSQHRISIFFNTGSMELFDAKKLNWVWHVSMDRPSHKPNAIMFSRDRKKPVFKKMFFRDHLFIFLLRNLPNKTSDL
jgi:hypothetical protein